MGRIKMVNVSLDNGETNSEGIRGFDLGNLVQMKPVAPMRKVFPTEDAAAAMTEDKLNDDDMALNEKKYTT